MSPTHPDAIHLRDGGKKTDCGREVRMVTTLRDYPTCLEHLAMLCDDCANVRRSQRPGNVQGYARS